MKASEFLRKLKALANRQNKPYQWVPHRGSGSHGTAYLGGRLTVVKEFKQLGIRKEEL